MFLSIVDLPLEQREQFVDWGLKFMTSTDAKQKLGAEADVVAYLARVLRERSAGSEDDLLSRIARWRQNPRFEGEHEVIGIGAFRVLRRS